MIQFNVVEAREGSDCVCVCVCRAASYLYVIAVEQTQMASVELMSVSRLDTRLIAHHFERGSFALSNATCTSRGAFSGRLAALRELRSSWNAAGYTSGRHYCFTLRTRQFVAP